MKKSIIIPVCIWIVLAILNIVSIFTCPLFLHISNYIFGAYNGILSLSLITAIMQSLKKPKK